MGDKNMKKKFQPESFLASIVGNMNDYIRNLIFDLQRYVNNTYVSMPELFMYIQDIEDDRVRRALHFLSVESENIVKQKGLWYAIDAHTLIEKKYNRLVKSIKESKDCTFNIYSDGFKYLDTFQNNIDWKNLRLNIYSKNKADIEELLDLTGHMEDKFKFFYDIQFQNSKKGVTKTELIDIITDAYKKLIETLEHFKTINESSTSMYLTINSCRKITSILVLACYIISTIEMVQEC